MQYDLLSFLCCFGSRRSCLGTYFRCVVPLCVSHCLCASTCLPIGGSVCLCASVCRCESTNRAPMGILKLESRFRLGVVILQLALLGATHTIGIMEKDWLARKSSGLAAFVLTNYVQFL